MVPACLAGLFAAPEREQAALEPPACPVLPMWGWRGACPSRVWLEEDFRGHWPILLGTTGSKRPAGAVQHLLSEQSTESGRLLPRARSVVGGDRTEAEAARGAQPRPPTGPAATAPAPEGHRGEGEAFRARGWGPGSKGVEHLPPPRPCACRRQDHRPVPRALILSKATVLVCGFEIKMTTGCHSEQAVETASANGK